MRIGLDARYASDHFPGIGRYILNLARALAELPHEHELILIYNPQQAAGRYNLQALAELPKLTLAPIAAGPFALSQQYSLPQAARRLRLDLLHSPYFIKPYFGLPCPAVVTIYDLLGFRFPETLSWRGRLLYRITMNLAVRTADALITISDHASQEMSRRYGIGPEKLRVTPLAADTRFSPQPASTQQELRQRYNLPERYVLYVGSNKPHKNLERLILAWEGLAEPGVCLLLAGHEDPKHPELRRLVEAKGLGDRIRFLPNLSDTDLPALYSAALCFVFPSYYEGFGLPPLEAMACGTPVVCANSSSLPEVVGDAALLINPSSIDSLRAGLARIIGDAELRKQLRTQGLARAQRFSWRRTAEATLQTYEHIGGREMGLSS